MSMARRLVLVAGGCVGWLALVAAKPAPPARGPQVQSVTLVIRSRVFHEFRDMAQVKLNQDFPLGDSEYSARVVQYLPDFQMDIEHHRFFSLSDQPNNPAFRIIVRKNKAPQDTTWGFFKSGPPHFGARSFFGFQVVRIDFVGRAPMVADSTRSVPMPPSAHGAGVASPAAPRDSAKKP
jgi:hypothetical protein